MEFPVRIALSRPVTVEGQEIAVLVFDEPTLRVNIAVAEAKGYNAQMVALLSGMADVSAETILSLRESDFAAVSRQVLEPYQQDASAAPVLRLAEMTEAEALAAVRAHFGEAAPEVAADPGETAAA